MNKAGYDAQIAQVMNGVVIKIGCKVFIGVAEDLEKLVDYYKGEIPDGLKNKLRSVDTFRRATATHGADEAVEVETAIKDTGEQEMHLGLPAFVHAGPGMGAAMLYKVFNGYIVVKPNGTAWIAKTAVTAGVMLGLMRAQ